MSTETAERPKYTLSEVALEQRQTNSLAISRGAALEKLKGLPRGVPIRRRDFPDNIFNRNFITWKKFGFLESPKYGYYLITLPEEGGIQ